MKYSLICLFSYNLFAKNGTTKKSYVRSTKINIKYRRTTKLQSISAVVYSQKYNFQGYFAALPIIPYSIEEQSLRFFPTILIKEKPEALFWSRWITKSDIDMQLTLINKKGKKHSEAMLGTHQNLKNNTV